MSRVCKRVALVLVAVVMALTAFGCGKGDDIEPGATVVTVWFRDFEDVSNSV